MDFPPLVRQECDSAVQTALIELEPKHYKYGNVDKIQDTVLFGFPQIHLDSSSEALSRWVIKNYYCPKDIVLVEGQPRGLQLTDYQGRDIPAEGDYECFGWEPETSFDMKNFSKMLQEIIFSKKELVLDPNTTLKETFNVWVSLKEFLVLQAVFINDQELKDAFLNFLQNLHNLLSYIIGANFQNEKLLEKFQEVIDAAKPFYPLREIHQGIFDDLTRIVDFLTSTSSQDTLVTINCLLGITNTVRLSQLFLAFETESNMARRDDSLAEEIITWTKKLEPEGRRLFVLSGAAHMRNPLSPVYTAVNKVKSVIFLIEAQHSPERALNLSRSIQNLDDYLF